MIYLVLILIAFFIFFSVSGGNTSTTNDPVTVSETVSDLDDSRTRARNQANENPPDERRTYSSSRRSITTTSADTGTEVSNTVDEEARRIAGSTPAPDEPSGDTPAPRAPVSVFSAVEGRFARERGNYGTGQIVGS